jgi:hypothetical protein
MSAPTSELISWSISSSGHVDGLGRRSLSFDHETGVILERVHVRPEVAIFEQVLQRRVEHLSTLEEPRIARPIRVERDEASRELVVLAEFVSGSRVSDLLDVSTEAGVLPGVDVALGYLLEALPALSSLHTAKRTTHGLIDPTRTVLTADGRMVLLDVAFGAAVAQLRFSPRRLWTDFGVCGSSPAGPVVFDTVCDLTQTSLVALMLVLGRNLGAHEYPDALPTLMMEVIEVAQIRGTADFAVGLQRILQRSLPLPGRRPYGSAGEALLDVRQLVRREIGLDVCRQAVIDFVAQMDAAICASVRDSAVSPSSPEPAAATRSAPQFAKLDPLPDAFATEEMHETAGAAAPAATTSEVELFEEEDEQELEISLEQIEPAPQPQQDVEEVYDLPALDELSPAEQEAFSTKWAAYEAIADSARAVAPTVPPEPLEIPTHAPEPVEASGAPLVTDLIGHLPEKAAPLETIEPGVPLVSDLIGGIAKAHPEPAPSLDDRSQWEDAAPDTVAASASADPAQAETVESDQHVEHETPSGRRRKRQQQKSARARKDKLRSTTSAQKMSPATPPPPAPPPATRPASATGWLVAPHRAAASESLIPDPVQAPSPPTFSPVVVPAMPSFSPTPVGQIPQPTYASSAAQASPYGTPTVVKPPPPTPPVVQPVATVPVKAKAEPPSIAIRKPARDEQPVAHSGFDRFTTLSLGRPEAEEATRKFPWKLAAIAVAVAAVGIVLGRGYLPGRTAVVGEPGAQAGQSPAPPPAGEDAPLKADSPIPPGRGRINIQTEPAGIKVLLDRKAVGVTPVIVDAAPGRRILTFLTSGGEVIHSVRVVAGKTATMDVPVFSGWVSIAAPIILEVFEEGRSLGTTEQSRLVLPPGRHRLTLSNKELGYSSVHQVDIEPAGVRSISVAPKGEASLNASPWAEVWLEGTKLGETPLANAQVPLGLREFVFKHPELGERRVSVTIRGTGTATVSADFTK